MSGWDTGNTGSSWDAGESAPAAAGGPSIQSESGRGVDVTDMNGGENSGCGGGDRACFNCGQPGHQKSECTNEAAAREFTGECCNCGQVGHRRAECPDAQAESCKNCEEPDHNVKECTNPRKHPFAHVVDLDSDTAWKRMLEAIADRDTFDFKEAALCYLKATPGTTFADLNQALINKQLRGYLIAIEGDAGELYTLMDAQGNLGKTYQVTFRFSPGPQRASEAEAFPNSPEENAERLKDAGISISCLMDKCSNCNELGHTRKRCDQEKAESTRAKVTCVNCEQDGHRSRDCPEPRKDKFACKNCGQGGHLAKECPEPRNPANIECKECNEIGHFSRDCPTKPQVPCFNCGQTGHRKNECTNEAVLICRNCDAEGHVGKDCPKKKDWSRVTCRNCNEKGHSQVKCPQPPKEEGDGGADNYNSATAQVVEEYVDSGAPVGGDGW